MHKTRYLHQFINNAVANYNNYCKENQVNFKLGATSSKNTFAAFSQIFPKISKIFQAFLNNFANSTITYCALINNPYSEKYLLKK